MTKKPNPRVTKKTSPPSDDASAESWLPTSPAQSLQVKQEALFLGWSPRDIENFRHEMARKAEAEAAEGRALRQQYRQGRRPGRVPWHHLVREWNEEGLTFPKIWARARHVAKPAHPILVAVVESSANPACNMAADDSTHPRGPHWHCRNRHGRIVPVADGTIKNFITRLLRK